MKKILDRLNQFFETSPDVFREHRVRVWIVFIVVTALVSIGIPRIRIDMSMESFFAEDDPAKVLFDRFRETFGSDDSVYIVYEAKDGDIFSEASLRVLRQIQDELQNPPEGFSAGETAIMERIVEVKSLINVSYLEVEDDSLISREFIDDNIPVTDEEREKLRKQALEHKDYPLFYLSSDSKYGGIWIRTDFGVVPEGEETGEEFDEIQEEGNEDQDGATSEETGTVSFKTTTMPEYAEFIRAIEKIIQKPEYTKTLKFYPVGNPVMMGFFNDVINVEMETLLSGALFLMMIVLLFLFRSVSAVLWPISIVVFSSLLVTGMMGWCNVVMSMMFSLLIMLVLVVGIADSVHVLSGYLFFRRNLLDHRAALRAVMKRSGLACMLTSITTSLGMFSLAFVPIAPIRFFGLFAGIGVLLAFVLTIILLPLMLDIWQPVSRKRASRISDGTEKTALTQKFLRSIEPYSHSYPKFMVIVFLIVFGIAVYGVTKVRVDSNLVSIIKKGLPIREAHELVDRVMGGTQSMEIFLDFKTQDALKDPMVLNAMEEIQRLLESKHQTFVVRTNSLVNVVKSTYQALNEDREEMYIIPQDKMELAQTLFMFDGANPDDRQRLVPDDYSQGRITVRLLNYGSMEYTDFFQDVHDQVDTIFNPLKTTYPEMTVEITGALALLMKMVEYINWSQIQSFGIALTVITVMLFLVFGSPKVGIIAMVPNLFPVVVVFGVMGYFGIALDADTLLIAPIVIGIAVDDSIHFLTHYRAEFVESGDSIKSVVTTVREVGQAIVFSTLILVIGFTVLLFSVHQGMVNFGILSAVAFCSALLADLLMLPSLCILLKAGFGRQESVEA